MAGLGSERDRVAIAKPSQTRSFVSAKLFLPLFELPPLHPPAVMPPPPETAPSAASGAPARWPDRHQNVSHLVLLLGILHWIWFMDGSLQFPVGTEDAACEVSRLPSIGDVAEAGGQLVVAGDGERQ